VLEGSSARCRWCAYPGRQGQGPAAPAAQRREGEGLVAWAPPTNRASARSGESPRHGDFDGKIVFKNFSK